MRLSIIKQTTTAPIPMDHEQLSESRADFSPPLVAKALAGLVHIIGQVITF